MHALSLCTAGGGTFRTILKFALMARGNLKFWIGLGLIVSSRLAWANNRQAWSPTSSEDDFAIMGLPLTSDDNDFDFNEETKRSFQDEAVPKDLRALQIRKYHARWVNFA